MTFSTCVFISHSGPSAGGSILAGRRNLSGHALDADFTNSLLADARASEASLYICATSFMYLDRSNTATESPAGCPGFTRKGL